MLRTFQFLACALSVCTALPARAAADRARQNALQQLDADAGGARPAALPLPAARPSPADGRSDARQWNESMVAAYLKDAVATRARWEADGRKLRDVLHRLAGVTKELARLKQDLAGARDEQRKLQKEKERALEELRRGDFCSGCGDTRSKIEAAGQRFPHEGQVRRPARPEDFERLENEFAGRFATLKKKIDGLEEQRRRKEPDARDLHFRYMNLLPPYHTEIARESDLRARAWNTEKDFIEKQVDAVTARLAELGRAPDAEAAALSSAELRGLERDLSEQLRRAESRFLRAEQDANAYVQAATRDLESTSATAAPIVDEAGVPTGWFLSRSILTPPTAVACRVYRIRQYKSPASGGARNILEPGAPRPVAPANSAARPSARDLLEGP